MKRDPICFISERIAKHIIATRRPEGRFIVSANFDRRTCFTAIDNTTGEAWTEDFASLDDAKAWLEGVGR